MDEETKQHLQQLNAKIDAIYVSVEKTRKYFMATLIATAIIVILPLLALAFIIPKLLNTFENLYSGLI